MHSAIYNLLHTGILHHKIDSSPLPVHFTTSDIVSASSNVTTAVPDMDFTVDASFSGLVVKITNQKRPVTAMDVKGIML